MDLDALLSNNPDLAAENPELSRGREKPDQGGEGVAASLSGAHSQAKGQWGESQARGLLVEKGVEMVEQIATPIKIIATKTMRDGKWYKIVWGEKVSGDWRGILPDGRRVLAEVKARDRNLRYSDLQDHQHEALDRNVENGGVSLLVYIHPDVRVVMKWPIEGFVPRKSIKPENAHKHEWEGAIAQSN